MEMEAFRGVWLRSQLFQPVDTLIREDHDDSVVLWIQSPCGIFIDIRVQKSMTIQHFKSFSGAWKDLGGFNVGVYVWMCS